MSLFKDLISQIDPSSAPAPSVPAPVQRSAVAPPKPTPKPTSRPATPVNGASENTALKRKASGTIENSQVKAQRKEAAPPLKPINGAARGTATSAAKPNSTTLSSIPYRGTAASATARPNGTPIKKPTLQVGTGMTISKTSAITPKSADPKSAGASPSTSATAPPKKVGGYMAMLMKAKEKEQTKPATPPIKHESTKILSKKDREKMRLEAKLASKGKKPAAGPLSKGPDGKLAAEKEKRKPAEVGYQGTARPSVTVKKSTEISYKGTARPSSAAVPNGKSSAAAAKSQSKPARKNEYVSWSDDALDMDDDDDEDDYASDGSSDMEGGIWDVEEEETEALRAAKREDAEEEKRLKELAKQKEERKRKLLALASSNATKRRY